MNSWHSPQQSPSTSLAVTGARVAFPFSRPRCPWANWLPGGVQPCFSRAETEFSTIQWNCKTESTGLSLSPLNKGPSEFERKKFQQILPTLRHSIVFIMHWHSSILTGHLVELYLSIVTHVYTITMRVRTKRDPHCDLSCLSSRVLARCTKSALKLTDHRDTCSSFTCSIVGRRSIIQSRNY